MMEQDEDINPFQSDSDTLAEEGSIDLSPLLEDPEYVEFLEAFDELSGPEDKLSLDELMTYGEDQPTDLDEKSIEWNEPQTNPDISEDEDVSIATALLDELEQGKLSDDRRTRLQEQLIKSEPASVETRVSYLESELTEFAAYIDALEEFIDENGTAEQLLEDITEQLSTLEDELAQIQENQSSHADQLNEVKTTQESLTTRQDEIESKMGEDLPAFEQTIEEINSELTELASEVESITQWKQSLHQTFE